jgi:cell division protein FtsI/penicillin-binding protein 2
MKKINLKSNRERKKSNSIFSILGRFTDKHILDFVFIGFFFFALTLVFSLYKLQILKGYEYNQQVLQRNTGSIKLERRGTIFFNNHNQGRTAVALQGVRYVMYVVPDEVKNKKDAYKQISGIIDIDEEEFLRKVNKKGDPREDILHKFLKDDVIKIKNLNIAGVYIQEQSGRKYPFNEVSGKIIGLINKDDPNDKEKKNVGSYGLEKYYEDILTRKKDDSNINIFMSFFDDSLGKDLFAKKLISKEGNLLSSIDIGLSAYIEKILKNIDEKYESKYSAAIVMKPHSGEIIAMTDSKNFNLNTDRKSYPNVFVEHRFEIGSTFKPLVVAIGLESGKINKDFTYYDSGCVKFIKKTICNFDKEGRGKNTDLQKIISHSLNTGMIEIEKKIGHDDFLKYMLDLGLAEETGIDLPREISSTISNLNNGVDIDYAAASFGQGVAFTPIGITRALSSIANDGYIVTPHIIQKIEYGGLIPDKEFDLEAKKVFSPYTIKTIKDIMIERADKYAENKYYYNKNYAVASKTGTAQIASPDGGYYTDRNIHSYFGFFPAYAKPEDRYAIFIYTLEPKNVKFSSQTLTEPFYNIMNFIIPYFKVKPDRVRVSL